MSYGRASSPWCLPSFTRSLFPTVAEKALTLSLTYRVPSAIPETLYSCGCPTPTYPDH